MRPYRTPLQQGIFRLVRKQLLYVGEAIRLRAFYRGVDTDTIPPYPPSRRSLS